ncbi:MAG: type II toxin-antitoxin system RatA family toxin [Gammaproteobacteria bacterium]|nr:type II toxin-antitoxin system RatA family toxin [Gammaproteobacteria bacterium]
MPTIQRSAIMPFSAEVMYDIVNDVEAYPRFLPWCGGTKIINSNEKSMEASILMKKGLLNHWFTTHNRLYKNERIELNLVNGPFRALRGSWYFHRLDEDATKIELDLTFEFSSGVATSVLTPIFSKIANTMVDSFCYRAYELN